MPLNKLKKFDIQISLEKCPPNYGKGLTWLKRIAVNLDTLIIKDAAGVTLQPRKKNLEEQNTDDLTSSFEANGILYDREVMVVEERADGELELISGFNRHHVLLKLGITTWFVDVVTFTGSTFYKALWKRRLNATKDHIAVGVPNTEGSFLWGLSEARDANSFDWKDDRVVLDALDFMANGSKTKDQLEKLLKKWRQTNHKDDHVRGLNRSMVQEHANEMGLPSKGYCKDTSKSWYGRTGYHVYGGDFSRKIKEWIDLYDDYGEEIELYGYIQHVVADKINNQRQEQFDKYNEICTWMDSHLAPKFHGCVVWKGWHAQLTTKNPKDGGRSLERGIVDVNGKIIIDTL